MFGRRRTGAAVWRFSESRARAPAPDRASAAAPPPPRPHCSGQGQLQGRRRFYRCDCSRSLVRQCAVGASEIMHRQTCSRKQRSTKVEKCEAPRCGETVPAPNSSGTRRAPSRLAISLSRSLAIRGPFSPCYPGEKRREGASRYPGLLLALLSLSRLLACSLARLAISLACSLARLLAGSRPKGPPMFLRCARAVGTVLTQAVAPSPCLVRRFASLSSPKPRPAHTHHPR